MRLPLIEFWLTELHPTWSLSECRARVVEVIDETADARTFVLAPNHLWPGHLPGQHVAVEVELAGVRTRRCYSITSPPGEDTIAITVQRVPGGRVSNHLHDHIGVGAVVRLGTPAGDFILSEPTPAKLLFVAGGSGVTPVIAIVRDLAARGATTDVVVLHAARSDADAIFGRELAALAQTRHGLRLIAHRGGPITPDQVTAAVPDLAEREVYVCGPSGLIDLVIRLAPRAHHERFVAPVIVPRALAAPSVVRLAIAGRDVAIDGRGTLLEQLERAGERPAHGCRMGICGTCRCRKRAGTVHDLVTGLASSAPDEDIKLCMTSAGSDLDLAL